MSKSQGPLKNHARNSNPPLKIQVRNLRTKYRFWTPFECACVYMHVYDICIYYVQRIYSARVFTISFK